MTDTTEKLKKTIEGLKDPRTYFRGKAIAALMGIKDSSTIPHLFKIVAHETDFIKIQFCRFLGKHKVEVAVPPLIVFLLDKSEKVAIEATNALDKIDNDRKTESLMKVVKNGNLFSKKYAIKALGEGRKVKAVTTLLLLLQGEETEIRELAIDALRQIGDPEALPYFVKLLKDKDDKIVYLVLFAIGEMGGQKTVKEISKFLEHKNQNIRKAAVWAVGRLSGKKNIGLLSKILKTDKSDIVREEVVRVFGKLGTGEVVLYLLEAKAFDKANNVRVYAEWALADLSLEQKERVLLRYRIDKDENIRGNALLELAKTGKHKFFKILTEAYKTERSEFTRGCIVEGLAFVHTPETKIVLKEALKDTKTVRDKAADALLLIADKGDEDLAVNMMEGIDVEDVYVREVGVKIVGKIFSEATAPENVLSIFYNLFEGQPIYLRELIIKILGTIGTSSTISFLRKIYPDTEQEHLQLGITEAIDLIKKK